MSRSPGQAEAALRVYQAVLPYSENDRVLAVLPFSHSFGLFNVLLASLAAGATLHIAPFSPRETAATIERARITVLPAGPFMFRMLSETEFRTVPDFSSVRLAVSTGSALSPAVALRFREKFGIGLAQCYGATEAGPIAVARPEERVDRPGWVGTPCAGVAVEIWDPAGKRLGLCEEGEVAVKSAAATCCYIGDAEASEDVFRNGYVLTGDMGCMDEAGRLFVLGRKRPMLNVAGKKVAPYEVEACLRMHPSVADVTVVGAATADGDERVKAFVVPAGEVTSVELQEFCGKRLADFKVPRQVVFVNSLSRGHMGKPPTSLGQTEG